MPDHTLLQRLFLDAQEEFLAAIDHVPNPGRGGSIGSLNPTGWTIAHLASTHDAWINLFCAAGQAEPWADAWYQATGDRNSPPTEANLPSVGDARGSFERVAEPAARWIEGVTWEELLQPAELPLGSPPAWEGVQRAYLVARAVAHAFVHAGDLTVVASLMAAGDLGLPGTLRRSTLPTAPDDPSVPVVAALLRDAFGEVRRVAAIAPMPAVTGAMDRLNPISHTLAHLLDHEDHGWSQIAQGREPNATLAAFDLAGEPVSLPWDACLRALDEVEEAVGPWLATLTAERGATTMQWRDRPSSYAAQVARSATHLFSHAGEMMAHASLYGAEDISQPGPLAHVGEAVGRMAGARRTGDRSAGR